MPTNRIVLKCEGTLNNPCPSNRSDETVSVRQGEIPLCEECNANRFGTIPKRRTEREIVIQPILSFILYAMQSTTIENIKRTVVNFYDLDAIIEAKNKLWAISDINIIGEICKRKHTASRTQREAHTQDILVAMQKLDKANDTPNFAVDALSLGMIPKFTSEEASEVTITEKQIRMEIQLKDLQESVSKILVDNLMLKDKVDSLQHPNELSYANTLKSAISHLPPKVRDRTADTNNSVRSTALSVNDDSNIGNSSSMHRKGNEASNAAKQNDLSLPPIQRWGSSTSIASAGVSSANQFQYQPRYKKKLKQEQNRQNKVLNGKSTTSRISGAPEPEREIFVYRVSPSTTVEDITGHLNDSSIQTKNIVCMSNDAAKFKSYKLTVPVSEMPKIFDESLWPVGIKVRRFYNKRQNVAASVNENDNNQ